MLGVLLVGTSAGHCISIWYPMHWKQALWERWKTKELIYQSDDNPYLSIRYTEYLEEANIGVVSFERIHYVLFRGEEI